MCSQLDGPSTVKSEGRFPDSAKCGLVEDRMGGLDDRLNNDMARAYALLFSQSMLTKYPNDPFVHLITN